MGSKLGRDDSHSRADQARKKWKTPKLLLPPPSERVEADLQKIEQGDVAYWVQLTLDLTLEPTSSHYVDDAGPDRGVCQGGKPPMMEPERGF